MRDKKENWFAKPLPKEIRFITALNMTSLKLFHNTYNIHKVLIHLMCKPENKLTADQYLSLNCFVPNPKKINEIANCFYHIYNDEDALVAYLNKEITKKYFRKNKKPGDSAMEATVKNIINENIDSILNFDDE